MDPFATKVKSRSRSLFVPVVDLGIYLDQAGGKHIQESTVERNSSKKIHPEASLFVQALYISCLIIFLRLSPFSLHFSFGWQTKEGHPNILRVGVGDRERLSRWALSPAGVHNVVSSFIRRAHRRLQHTQIKPAHRIVGNHRSTRKQAITERRTTQRQQD